MIEKLKKGSVKVLSVIGLFLLGFNGLAIEVAETSVEWIQNPVGISATAPRFSWKLTSDKAGDLQSSYQILVASSLEKLQQNEGDIWNSGKVNSNQSQMITYLGSPLTSETRYYYKVKIWDRKGKPSKWSTTAYWEMAPDPVDLQASWIGAITRKDSHLPEGRNFHAPSLKKDETRAMYENIDKLAKRSIMLRKEVNLDKSVARATINISGLGHYELNLNGSRIGNSEFAPLWTDYDKTVLFNTYDVTDFLQSGQNAIGVLLGNGMYNVVGDRYRKFWVSFGPPTLFFRLKIEFADGSSQVVESDASWKYAESPVTFNCIFGGEDYDARLEHPGWSTPGFDDRRWKPVVIQEPPKGKLTPQLAPPVGIQQTFQVKDWSHVDSSVYVFDMGQNLSGFPEITVRGQRGQKVRLYVGEQLDEDSTVNQRNTGRPHYYEYILKGTGEESWRPKFSYYGYQYVQVEGATYGDGVQSDLPRLLDLKSHFVYSSAEEVGAFECSNDIFSQTHILINNAVKSNMQAVFTDCPHREKLGWLEEIHLNGPGLLFNYNLTGLFAKEMRDMADAQRENGLIPSIAPEYVVFGGDFTDSPEWGSAAIIMPWMYYEFYGDSSLIVQYYDTMKKYFAYLTSKSENGILSHGLGDWYDYGEHRAGYSKNSPIALSATAHYYYDAMLIARAADLQRMEEEADFYKEEAERIRLAFNQEFYNPASGQYGTGSQFSNAVAVFMNIVDSSNREQVIRNLIADIEHWGNRLTTGDVGNRYLFQTLAENGLNELMYKMNNHHEAPGYGYQLQYGLTTLTEQWDPKHGNSWNHFMLGQIEEWFFKSLAGIQPDKEIPGFKHFYLRPGILDDLEFVKASHECVYGNIEVEWRKENDALNLLINVPVNTTATIILPRLEGLKSVKGICLTGNKQLKVPPVVDDQFRYTLHSGKFSFKFD